MKNLGFIHKDFIKSLLFAKEVAGKLNSRVATLPDLIKLRINQDSDSFVWERWMIPFSTLYFGVYKRKKIIVIAHHLGPLNNEERIKKWHDSSEKSHDQRFCYGYKGLPRITQIEFNNLVEGKYGEVSIVDFWSCAPLFLKHLEGRFIDAEAAKADPLLQALIGPEINQFIDKLLAISKKFTAEHDAENSKKAGNEQKILQLEIKDHNGFNVFQLEGKEKYFSGEPVALFLSLDRLTKWLDHDLSVSTSIDTISGCRDYGRFVVLNNEEEGMVDIDFEPRKHWKKTLTEYNGLIPKMVALTREGKNFFSQYPKEGCSMDTGIPMFKITEIKEVGKPIFFEVRDCLMFLRYDIKDVEAVAPKGANAYTIIGDVKSGDEEVLIQFFKVKFDKKHRVLKTEEVMNELPLLLKINDIEFD